MYSKTIKPSTPFLTFMTSFGDLHKSEEVKSFLREKSIEVIMEYQQQQAQIMQMYKMNSTFPSDFYNLSLREIDARISGIKEFYKRITNEDLEFV